MTNQVPLFKKKLLVLNLLRVEKSLSLLKNSVPSELVTLIANFVSFPPPFEIAPPDIIFGYYFIWKPCEKLECDGRLLSYEEGNISREARVAYTFFWPRKFDIFYQNIRFCMKMKKIKIKTCFRMFLLIL